MTDLPSLAPADAVSLPLHVIAPDDLPDWLTGPGAAWAGWLAGTGFEAALGELRLLPGPDGLAGAIIGTGTAKARARGRFGLAKAVAALPAGDWHLTGEIAGAAADEAVLGWLLASYRFDTYRPGKTPAALPRLKLPDGVDGETLLAMAAGEYLTRDLINTPANDMGPEQLQAAFFALAQEHGATATAIVGDDLLAQNFPMIHAVGRASPRAPRLLDMRWGTEGPALTLVGKGVCFDTGGLDLKPSAGMLLMKKDMGGAATVMGLALMIMRLGLPLRLRVLVPAVENSVSGSAMRPRDILTSRKGLTVEINNTDAEGRLILADALTYACEERGATVISMATLTGAARVAVGPDLAPYFTDDSIMASAIAAGAATGFDPVWRLPFWDAYEPMIEPGIADLDNAPSGGFAGAITAALFLRRFVDTPHYAHFDIYGHNPADLPARPKGGAGQGARALLYALPEMLAL
ncbi:MAG: leucyl aminopeptidase family protein [Pseudotabrizicola sp.]|uniref:leucyl aminopeptidase family protein n=1 Tax=Pseudotabrizicola sp. TaxID=2939647 RepID=UPI002726CB10|nr:leucyl aminopeptidase family protein [Pseudotabrizicola sp.]MDO8883114.1 leucyl aminopeptidase family protein [Pseudotabrizicola sp.]MDP2081879.1 leucyl aminopeptidase family protein [Pseudotabrizicola sp.]MDZ7573830.1 leucyl aminopeptidase family protein [Pseudotabrizicola sp.]